MSSAADEYSKAHLPQLFLSKKYESELKSSKVHTAVSLTINTLRVQWDEQSQTVRDTVTSTFALVKDEEGSDRRKRCIVYIITRRRWSSCGSSVSCSTILS